MSQHTPSFAFGAVAAQDQAALAFASPHQQNKTTSPSSALPTSASTLPPPAQNAAFQQNAQLPGIDMSMLAGVSPDQVALIAQLLQSGALAPPPPPSSASAPAVQAPAALSQNDTSPPHVKAQQEDVDMDKEDGEVEEDEVGNKSLPFTADDPPKVIPTGPRNANSPKSTRRDARSRQSAGSIPSRRLSNHHSAHSANGAGIVIPYRAKEKQSQEFVLAMHQAGYSYRQLAEMVDNPQPLRRMFKLLGLPVSSDHGLSTEKLPSQAPPARSPAVASKSPAADSAQKTSATKPPAPPKPAAKADRSAYLAKLQALKAGKAGAVTTQPATPDSATKAPAADTAPSTTTQQVNVSSASPAATPAPTSKAVKTELARQRLEAFKAARAAKLQNQATGNGVPQVSSPAATQSTAQTASAAPEVSSHNGLGAGLNGIAATVGQQPSPVATPNPALQTSSQPILSPTQSTPSRSVSGLPGLFMNGLPQQTSTPVVPQPARTVSQPIVQVATAQQSTLPLKRLMTTDSSDVPPQAKRPFGQSRSASEDESFIIENSDDEDEDTRMDIDTVSTRGRAPGQLSLNPSLLQDASPKPGLPHASASSTPGPATPGGMTYEQRLKAIEELNRRIAEKEAKNKAQGKAAVAKGDVTPAGSTLPGISTPSATASSFLAREQVASPVAAPAAPGMPDSAAASKQKQEKEDLRQRLAKLENARRQTSPTTLPTEDLTSNSVAAAGVSDMRPTPEAATMGLLRESTPAPVAAANVVEPSSEEGELEDESDFDFYGDEEPVTASKPSAVQEHVGSQATTASAATDVDVFPEESPVPIPEVPGLAGAGQDTEMAEGALAQASDGSADGATSEATPEPVLATVTGMQEEMSESVQAQPTPPDSDVNMETESSESDDSSDDAESDLDDPTEPADVDGSNDMDGPSGFVQPAALEEGNGDTGQVRGPATVADIPNAAAAQGGDQGVDDIESSDASSIGSSESEEYEPEPAEVPDDSSYIQPDDKVPADDLAPELQPSEEEQTATAPTDQQLHADNPKTYYTPYQSIMTKFRDYRYHPQYLDTVPSGFKSRTYNHQIDPMKQLCPIEAQGGTCHDKDCRGQHFDRMSISDNILLQQMGTKNIPAHTKDEVEKWNVGLHEVIRKLKAADVRDAATIAARIAEYRREFTGDPSRVITIP